MCPIDSNWERTGILCTLGSILPGSQQSGEKMGNSVRKLTESGTAGSPGERTPLPIPGAPGKRLHGDKQLTVAQAQRLDRLRQAARDLASEGGYAAVTMRDVAKRANVGLATVYRYFSSKDHLIADVHAMRSVEVIESLQENPPEGATAANRVAAVFGQMLEATAEDLDLAAAGVAAITSSDPVASSPQYWQSMVMVAYLDAALGEEDVGDRRELGEILGHMFFSLMIGLAAGRMPLEDCKRVMTRSVELILNKP